MGAPLLTSIFLGRDSMRICHYLCLFTGRAPLIDRSSDNTSLFCTQIEMQRRKGEPIPSGWAQGPDGRETTDAELVGFTIACRYLCSLVPTYS